MAALMLCSNSTMVSFGHSRLRISSRVTTSPECSSSMVRIRKGCSGRRSGLAPFLRSSGANVEFEGFEADDVFEGVDCQCLPLALKSVRLDGSAGVSSRPTHSPLLSVGAFGGGSSIVVSLAQKNVCQRNARGLGVFAAEKVVALDCDDVVLIITRPRGCQTLRRSCPERISGRSPVLRPKARRAGHNHRALQVCSPLFRQVASVVA